MKRDKNIHISLYILVPAVFTGLSVISAIVAYSIAAHYLKAGVEPGRQVIWWWSAGIGAFTFLSGFFILRFILAPVTRFVAKTETLPAFPKIQPGQGRAPKNDPGHYSQVFEQITDILSKVEAGEFFPGIIGQSRAMRAIFSQIMKVAPTDSTVLILGESGTGKELAATAIYEHSLRKGRPFVKLNCVAIPEGLLESEFFGHEKGAFTGAVAQKKGKFELADGGTIFLDEIGDMPLATQAKILRVLQEREFERVGGNRSIRLDVRFLAASNRDLQKMARDGQFREDLYWRLNVFSLQLPPLRQRREDIPLLAEHFLEKASGSVRLSSPALQLLIGYSWPGNVRELQNVIERAAVVAGDGGIIEPLHLPSQIRAGQADIFQVISETASLDERLHEIEKSLLIEALTRTGGSQLKAARLLGIKDRSLWHRLKKYGIEATSFKNLQSM